MPLSPYMEGKVVEKTAQKVEKIRPRTSSLKRTGMSRNQSVGQAKTVRFKDGF